MQVIVTTIGEPTLNINASILHTGKYLCAVSSETINQRKVGPRKCQFVEYQGQKSLPLAPGVVGCLWFLFFWQLMSFVIVM